MILKIMSLFLLGMMVLAMFGKLRLPKMPKPRLRAARRCPNCDMPQIGKGPCACAQKDRS
ncbi:MAG: hypothetical protein AAGA12_10410 [Pseudomonadota bacterium]